MSRRAFTLIEVLVAVVIMGVIVSGVLVVLRYQHRNWTVRQDEAEMRLMAKGVFDELTRSVRMAGGQLPPMTAGLAVRGVGPERLAFSLNETAARDSTAGASTYSPSDRTLRIPMARIAGYSDQGYCLTTVKIPPFGSPSGTLPTRDTLIVLPVVGLQTLTGADLLVASVPGLAGHFPWAGALRVDSATLIYNLDSIHYEVSADTLFKKKNRAARMPFALQVDTLSFRYHFRGDGWSDSLLPATAGELDRVRIVVRIRTRSPDPDLLRNRPATRGYRFENIETELSLRNWQSLRNR